MSILCPHAAKSWEHRCSHFKWLLCCRQPILEWVSFVCMLLVFSDEIALANDDIQKQLQRARRQTIFSTKTPFQLVGYGGRLFVLPEKLPLNPSPDPNFPPEIPPLDAVGKGCVPLFPAMRGSPCVRG